MYIYASVYTFNAHSHVRLFVFAMLATLVQRGVAFGSLQTSCSPKATKKLDVKSKSDAYPRQSSPDHVGHSKRSTSLGI